MVIAHIKATIGTLSWTFKFKLKEPSYNLKSKLRLKNLCRKCAKPMQWCLLFSFIISMSITVVIRWYMWPIWWSSLVSSSTSNEEKTCKLQHLRNSTSDHWSLWWGFCVFVFVFVSFCIFLYLQWLVTCSGLWWGRGRQRLWDNSQEPLVIRLSSFLINDDQIPIISYQ